MTRLSPLRRHRLMVMLLLIVLASLLAYSATQHGPTDLEPAFLASGISHWEFGRFEAYRVNPPFVRMVAALPVLATGYQADWSNFYEGPGARAEFSLGEAFLRANGPNVIHLFYYARWACIPFSLIGAFFAYRWASDLYGPTSGLVTLTLFVFEPSLLAHGELITPDAACTAFGLVAGYLFWKWLQQPAWDRAALAGGALGLAVLSKMSWLILFGLWPVLWLIWRWTIPRITNRPNSSQSLDLETSPRLADAVRPTRMRPSGLQFLLILALGVYVINLGYGFDDTGRQLKDFRFVSTALSGEKDPGVAGNRFENSWLGKLPVPVPAQFVMGFDLQKKDFEKYHHRSYLRGEWRDRGWWYYYLYGLLVKVPCGTWAIFVIVIVSRLLGWAIPRIQSVPGTSLSSDPPDRELPPLRDEMILLAPAIALLTLVSSQSEFSIHFRYVFPALGLGLVYLGQAGRLLTKRTPLRAIAIGLSLCYAVTSSLLSYPNHLAYFNDFVGGPRYGHEHLLGSSLDWGQGTLQAIDWIKHNRPNSTIEYQMFSTKVAESLLPQSPPASPSSANTPTAPTAETSSNSPTHLILYSADRYSQRATEPTPDPNKLKPQEITTIRFPGGRVLVEQKSQE